MRRYQEDKAILLQINNSYYQTDINGSALRVSLCTTNVRYKLVLTMLPHLHDFWTGRNRRSKPTLHLATTKRITPRGGSPNSRKVPNEFDTLVRILQQRNMWNSLLKIASHDAAINKYRSSRSQPGTQIRYPCVLYYVSHEILTTSDKKEENC